MNSVKVCCDGFLECSKVIVNHCCYTTSTYGRSLRRNNSVIRLKDKMFVVIEKILVNETTCKILFFCLPHAC